MAPASPETIGRELLPSIGRCRFDSKRDFPQRVVVQLALRRSPLKVSVAIFIAAISAGGAAKDNNVVSAVTCLPDR